MPALLKIRTENCGHIPLKNTTPQYWFPGPRRVVIEPVPDAAYSLTLFLSDYPHAAMTLTTDFPTDLPLEFHPCIVDFACYVLSIRLRRWGDVARFYNRYITNLNRRKKDYIDRKAERRAVRDLPENVTLTDEGGRPWAH